MLGVTLLYGVGLFVIASMPPEPGVTRSNYYRLRVGMSKAEAVAILGGPSSPSEKCTILISP